jgi:hypothetical protein
VVRGELARQLGQFPFTKLKPFDFRVEIATLTTRELETHPVRVWVEIDDISKAVEIAGFARVLRSYPHLGFVYLETYARELTSLVASDLVRSVWNDLPVKAGGCLVVSRPDRSGATLAPRLDGRTG